MTTLMVASSGGHLNELVRLAPRLIPIDDDQVWVTDKTVQAQSLLAGAPTVFVPDVSSRDLRGAAAAIGLAGQILRAQRPDRVVSTGSAIAAAFLPVARLMGIPCHYVESGTRVLGPSATGRLLERVPGIHRYTQHQRWASRRWSYAGSILDGFEPATRDAPRSGRRIVVTLGTWRQPFRRLVEHLVPLLPPDADVLWQTGATDVTGLVAHPTPWVPAAELAAAVAAADVVITHAGMGATLDALDAGHHPVVLPRRPEYAEQIDDHQIQLAAELSARGLALVCEPEALEAEHLRQAVRLGTHTAADPRPFVLLR